MKMNSWRRNRFNKILLSLVAAVPLVVGSFGGAIAQDATPLASPVASPVAPGFITAERAYLVPSDPAALEVVPLVSAGDTVGDFQMAGSPIGIGGYIDGMAINVYVTHSLTTTENQNLSASRLSKFVIDKPTNTIISADYILDGTEGYEQLGATVKASEKAGLGDPLILAGEGITTGVKGGIVIAYEPKSDTIFELPWLGHMNHEGTMVVPGFTSSIAVLLTDGAPSGSELYLFVTKSREGLLNGDGQLYVFVANNAAGTADISKGQELTGTFVPLDAAAAKGDATMLQTSATAAGAFQFTSLRGIAWDRNDGKQTTIYFTDSGSKQGGTKNGRVYTLTMNPDDPTLVTGFKVLFDGDAGDDIKNPSSINNNKVELIVAEEIKKYNQTQDAGPTARIQLYTMADGTVRTLATVDQSGGDGTVDPGDMGGSWIPTGLLNGGDFYGHGSWLAVVQARTMTVPQFGGSDVGGQDRKSVV